MAFQTDGPEDANGRSIPPAGGGYGPMGKERPIDEHAHSLIGQVDDHVNRLRSPCGERPQAQESKDQDTQTRAIR